MIVLKRQSDRPGCHRTAQSASEWACMLMIHGMLTSPFPTPAHIRCAETVTLSFAGASCIAGRSTICSSFVGHPDGWDPCRRHLDPSSRGSMSKFCDQIRPLSVLSSVLAFAGPKGE